MNESICIYCKHFSPGWRASRFDPGEADDCGHAKLSRLMSHNMRRGVIKKCKGFQEKYPINYRDIQDLPKEDGKARAFDAILRREEPMEEVWTGWDEGSMGEFNRFIAADR